MQEIEQRARFQQNVARSSGHTAHFISNITYYKISRFTREDNELTARRNKHLRAVTGADV